MILHPVLLSSFALDLLTLVALVGVGRTALEVLLFWQPQSASREQLSLERAAEISSHRLRLARLLLGLTLLLWGWLVTAGLLPLVSGAMCGTGVLEAMGRFGWRTLLLRLVTFLLFTLILRLEAWQQRYPLAPFTLSLSRGVLVALPLWALAVVDGFRAWRELDPYQPVDCCSTVVQATRLPDAVSPSDSPLAWMAAFAVLSLALVLLAAHAGRSPSRRARWLLIWTAGWAFVASETTIQVLTAYHFRVLAHHCPWCLFLPAHHAVGYPLALTWGVAVLEACSIALYLRIDGEGTLTTQGNQRCPVAKSAWRLSLSVLVYALIALWPALEWRIRYGVWLLE